MNLDKQIHTLDRLLHSLQSCEAYSDKLVHLNSFPLVQNYLQQASPEFLAFFQKLALESEYVVKSIMAIGQAPIVFNVKCLQESAFPLLVQLLEQLWDLEVFYRDFGGIIGYHLSVLQLIQQQQIPQTYEMKDTHYLSPEGFHLEKHTKEAAKMVRWGIEQTPYVGVIYPLGGAGDRLNLKDDTTGIPLPAALLPFLGRNLLDGMIRDLQAREYVYFKLFKKQTITPIAIMTSIEKENHVHILNISKTSHWFGRPSDSFYFFIQPMVPVITCEGNWSLTSPLKLALKPCGHGVLWKLAQEQGVFKWLKKRHIYQCVIRQINNPLAGIDQAILALIGLGSHHKKTFGFLSCERLLNSEEGMNVLIETKKAHTYAYQLTNIEYTDFAKRGITDTPSTPDSSFSTYPANTNLLFANLSALEKTIDACPIPGQLINMKSKVSYLNEKGEQSFVSGGRLESTMQNIADFLVDEFPRQLKSEEYLEALQTFILHQSRSKTISTTKKTYKAGESPLSTPEQAYYDLLTNHYLLLEKCGFQLPPWRDLEEYLKKGPSCVFLFHPALGPLYSIISQKIRKGNLTLESELQLEMAEVDIENLSLAGSLVIESTSPLGTLDANGILRYGEESRCYLRNVVIDNQGIDRTLPQTYWKNDLVRVESVRILLQEGAEFHAENLTLKGAHIFEVPAHHRMTLRKTRKGDISVKLEPIEKASWQWEYRFKSDDTIKLRKIKTRTRKLKETKI